MNKIAIKAHVQALGMAALLALAGTAAAAEFRFERLSVAGTNGPNGWTMALDVNARGQVVGNAKFDDFNQKGYVYSQGRYTLLDGPSGRGMVWAEGISSDGTIVGSYTLPGDQNRGFIYSNGRYETFDVPGWPAVSLSDISPNGRYIAGYAPDGGGFVYDRWTATRKLLPSDWDSRLTMSGINDHGVVSGFGYTWLHPRDDIQIDLPFTYDSATGAYTLYHDYPWGVFYDIGNGGEVIAPAYGDANGSVLRIGRPDHFEFVRLNPGAGSVAYAFAMNESGWMAGNLRSGNRLDGFVAIPVPEPGRWALLAGGLAFVGWRARRHG